MEVSSKNRADVAPMLLPHFSLALLDLCYLRERERERGEGGRERERGGREGGREREREIVI